MRKQLSRQCSPDARTLLARQPIKSLHDQRALFHPEAALTPSGCSASGWRKQIAQAVHPPDPDITVPLPAVRAGSLHDCVPGCRLATRGQMTLKPQQQFVPSSVQAACKQCIARSGRHHVTAESKQLVMISAAPRASRHAFDRRANVQLQQLLFCTISAQAAGAGSAPPPVDLQS
jgi:hypothetical protein